MSYISENFSKWTPVVLRYINDRLAVEYRSEGEYGPESECIATINMPECKIAADEIIVKTYSENEGLYSCMLEAGHIGPELRRVSSGWITAPVCKLLLPIPDQH